VGAKDLYWQKVEGKWRMQMCALGQGMVDWPDVLGQVAAAAFTGPISLHIEYKPSDVREAIARDFTALKKLAETADSKEQS